MRVLLVNSEDTRYTGRCGNFVESVWVAKHRAPKAKAFLKPCDTFKNKDFSFVSDAASAAVRWMRVPAENGSTLGRNSGRTEFEAGNRIFVASPQHSASNAN